MRINKKFISVLTTYNFIWIKKAIVLSNNPKHIKASKTVWKETVYLAQGTLFYIRQFVKKNRFLLCNIISLFQSYSCTFISSVKLQNILGSPVYFVFLEEKHFPWIFELFFQGSGGGFSFVLKKTIKKEKIIPKKPIFPFLFPLQLSISSSVKREKPKITLGLLSFLKEIFSFFCCWIWIFSKHHHMKLFCTFSSYHIL